MAECRQTLSVKRIWRSGDSSEECTESPASLQADGDFLRIRFRMRVTYEDEVHLLRLP
jgi:hypothetical protein